MRRNASARVTTPGMIPRGPRSGGISPVAECARTTAPEKATKYITMPARIPCEGSGDHRGGMSANAPQPRAIRAMNTEIQEGRMMPLASSVPRYVRAIERGAQHRRRGANRDAAGKVSHIVAALVHHAEHVVGERDETRPEPREVESLRSAARDAR